MKSSLRQLHEHEERININSSLNTKPNKRNNTQYFL